LGEDQRIFKEVIRFLDEEETSTKFPGELMLDVGKIFLGAPYMAGTLEAKGTEHLVINLRKFDCVTFIENVVALVGLVKCREKSFKGFRRLIQKIRYRQGRLQGYSSRLHYFSDWIHDNQKKGIVRDVTAEIGGRPLRKAVSFMTAHSNLYPPLKNGANLRRMKCVERTIRKRSLFFIPKNTVMRLENRIYDGDIIAITTNTEGLDIQHVGLASKVKNRTRLLHASSVEGKVVLSKKTLYRYLMESHARSGIMVVRAF
jgi:hypothetical protein